MKKARRVLAIVISMVMLFVGTALGTFAHSGRTDSSGGHRDNKNKSGLGSYHYHCGGHPAHLHVSGYCPYRDTFPSSVSVKADKTTLGIGEKVSVTAAVYPSNACSTSVSWESSDTDVVRIRGNMIEAIGYGTAVITATTFNDIVGRLYITVKEITATKVTVTEVTEIEEDIYIGDTFELNAAIVPENVDNPSIVWGSSNEDVAVVDSVGKVDTISVGTVTITATASNGVVGKYVVEVKEKLVETIEIESDISSVLLDSTYILKATVLPEDATYPDVVWSSSDPAVIDVSETGSIFAAGCGTATITAMSSNGLTDSISVEVTEIVAEKIEIEGAESVVIEEDAQLNVAFYPSDTTVQKIAWSVDDESIATIDKTGKITALQVGEVTVTATQKDVADTFVVKVIPRAVESIMIESSLGKSLYTGDVSELSAIVSPANATYQMITWESSNTRVATIDEDGILEIKSIGFVTIIARAEDGYEETFEFVVMPRVSTILLMLLGMAAIGAAIPLISLKLSRRKRADRGEVKAL